MKHEVVDATNYERVLYEKGASPESVFAKFCGFLEDLVESKVIEEKMIGLINRLPLVLFEVSKANRVLEWEKQTKLDSIRIPFKSCIAVDSVGAVLLHGIKVVDRTPETEAVFADMDRQFDKRGEERPLQCAMADYMMLLVPPERKHVLMVWGKAEVCYDAHQMKRLIDVSVTRSAAKFADRIVFGEEYPDMHRPAIFDSCTSIGTALAQLQYMAQPGNYVVRETPQRVRQVEGCRRPIRAHERCRIRVLDPEEMKVIYLPRGSGCGSHASPLPHLRMGHWREFRDERFTHKKGQRIWIEEIRVKVGEQWEYKGKTYKIMERRGQ